MKVRDKSFNNNTEKNISLQDSINNNKNHITLLNGIISSYKDSQTLKIEKILNNESIPTKKFSLQEILENKDELFNKEYLISNSLYASINCYLKTNRKYEYGKLIVSNQNIVVELIKKAMKLREWSFSDISTTNAKNNSTDNQIPNIIMNDTIDKIVTGRNVEEGINKELPIYLLNINLDLVTCKLIVHKEKKKFRLLLLGNKLDDDYFKKIKVIKFNCINVEKSSFYHVCEVINKSIFLSEGYKQNIFGVNCNKYYYIKPYINVLNFVKEANNCDILLFKSFSSSSKCQRCITKGNYDHIALLMKEENNLLLYDCIEENGVRLRKFTDLIIIDKNLNYEKIVYRKLNINFDDMIKYIHKYNIDKYENIDNYIIENMSPNEIKKKFYKILNIKLKMFINNNINSKYDFPVCDFLCKSNKTKNTKKISKKSYFCSELVASVYMFCNIMRDKFEPKNYLPGAFSEKEKIEFINGFHLGPETIIDFSD